VAVLYRTEHHTIDLGTPPVAELLERMAGVYNEPFRVLDLDLAEFSASLPAILKVDGMRTKVLFKHALNRYWPPSVQSCPKLGFGSPYQIWLEFPEVKNLTQRVFKEGSRLHELLPGFRPAMLEGRPYETWNLLTLGLWLERHALD
jgi:hypothetical protein